MNTDEPDSRRGRSGDKGTIGSEVRTRVSGKPHSLMLSVVRLTVGFEPTPWMSPQGSRPKYRF